MANSAVDQPNRFLEQECISISVHFESLYPKKLTSWEVAKLMLQKCLRDEKFYNGWKNIDHPLSEIGW
jgi:hypothetical protein